MAFFYCVVRCVVAQKTLFPNGYQLKIMHLFSIFRLPEAIATRDAVAKCLYGALFDWIVMQVNHALLSKKDTLRDHQGNSIGMSDILISIPFTRRHQRVMYKLASTLGFARCVPNQTFLRLLHYCVRHDNLRGAAGEPRELRVRFPLQNRFLRYMQIFVPYSVMVPWYS